MQKEAEESVEKMKVSIKLTFNMITVTFTIKLIIHVCFLILAKASREA